ncbi:EAL domain-containing protein [Fusibacter sp. JL298sf-3]
MKNIPLNEIYSLLFFAVASAYAIIGIYVLSLNYKSALNRVFFILNFTLGIWAFSYSLLNTAATYEEALFWNRLSVLGWGTMYSFLLHYILLLTKNRFLKRKWAYAFIYVPALVNVVVFGLNSATARWEFELLQTHAGWVNTSPNSFYDYYFYGYYLVYSILTLLCIGTWKNASQDKKVKKTAGILSASIIISILLGSVSDVFLRQSLQDIRPQLGIVFALIPILAVLHSVKKHSTMVEQKRKVEFLSVKILLQEKRVAFYKALSFVFLLGSLAYLILDYLIFDKALSGILKFGGFVLALGLILWILPHLKIKERSQDIYMGLALVTIMPALYLHFGQYGYNSVIWTVPFFLMILTTVFKNEKLLLMVFASAIIVEFISMVRNEVFVTTIARADYQQRLAIYVLISAVIYYISHLYRNRLYEHEQQTALRKVVSKISSDFVSVTADNLEAKVDDMLRTSGEYFEVDRAYVFRFNEDLSTVDATNEWHNEATLPVSVPIGSLSAVSFPWWMKELEQNGKIYLADVGALPSEASAEREVLLQRDVKSLMLVPVLKNGKLLGFLGFDTVVNKKRWTIEQQEVLKIMANIISDAITKVEAEKKINYMAYYDALTALPNRTYFTRELEKKIEQMHGVETPIGILLMDIDEFKSINDTMGHDSGDQLLLEVSKRLSQVAGVSDTVCRFGGDEFLVVLPHMGTLSQIRKAIDHIVGVFDGPIEIKEQNFHVTASCGVAVYPFDGHNPETLIKSADLAMYASKNNGKNRVTFCTPLMKSDVGERVGLSNDLYKALENDELLLYYQPQVNIGTGKLVGLEALIRWRHPERGLLSPGVFIPLAEQTGLIHRIGEWVLKQACMQNKAWQLKGYSPVVVSVNLSIEQFRGQELVEAVSSALIESALAPRYLELEIKERIALKESSYVISILHRLKALGVTVAIDDFGTDYSSLSRLKELPIDKLKVAMEFIQGIGKDDKDEAVTAVIIDLAERLDLKVVAEGVEAEEQLAFLKRQLCDDAQGFYFHRPMPVDEVEKLMRGSDVHECSS